MAYFSLNAFILGVMVFLAISLSNFIYIWLCKIWKIKIIGITIFFSAWFTLYKRMFNGTTYTLGWLPLGSSIKPLGMLQDDVAKLYFDDVQFSFLAKSKSKQIAFRLTPFFVWIFILLLSLYTLTNPSEILLSIKEISIYIFKGVSTMFGSISHEDFINQRKNIVSFALILMISLYIILTPFTKIMSLFSREEKKTHVILKILGFLVSIFIIYLTFWKIPSFVFSFFSLKQSAIYFSSFLVGLYAIGLPIFILLLILAKLNNKQL